MSDSNPTRLTRSAMGHGYRHQSTYPLTAAMTEGKPATQHVDLAASQAEGATVLQPGTARTSAEGTAIGSEGPGHGIKGPSHKLNLNSNENARLANPLADLTDEEVMAGAAAFASANNLPVEAFRKGGLVAKRPNAFENMKELNESDKETLRYEDSHPYKQPWVLYNLVIACSVAAAVQGMDESVISGAQLFFPQQFGISSANPSPKYAHNAEYLEGLVNGAPYLCCAIIGCWMTAPLNRLFGRRGTIFITAMISFLTCIWSAVTNTWWHLFIARFFLGFGIGPKSATVPIFAAECTPARIRGSLVMQWQVWTAFGIMLGYCADLIFYHVPDHPHITGLNWRLMLASAGIPALFVMAQVFFLPESPRWLMSKGKYEKAYASMLRLRGNDLLAARDLYYIFVLLEEEAAVVSGRNLFLEIFTIPRNRRAMIGSTIVMFGQQFCGVNAIVYYTATIFTSTGFSEISALLASFGFGLINTVFAIPGMLTIDRFGRRPLLLITFPIMSILLLATGMSFYIPGRTARIGCITLFIYLYDCFYSSGEGPVPFTYSAEVYDLSHREVGMSLATAVLWGFNFIVAFTFPKLLTAFKPQGAFGWYAAWCAALFVLILFFLPESKGYSLEELDQVFSVPTGVHAKYQLYNLKWHFNHYVLRSKEPHRPLYRFDEDEDGAGVAAYENKEKRVSHHETSA
ncbi:D-xylose-proton symporter [Kwoniella heveanensis BCC8398]|uniref:D-xylose-proton symporter n=1 Tax=Kwoniella heveanensis BCC8398 TaxID=1296120 RepID=A0A1B9GZI3_9TREE|nr:D-xylose-proton symporter [Kwoniella heveanensis BCC8398]